MVLMILFNLRFIKFTTIVFIMNEYRETEMNSNMKKWLTDQHISYRGLARILCVSSSSVCKKVNGTVSWQPKDLRTLNERFGLSADFVLGFRDTSETLQPV